MTSWVNTFTILSCRSFLENARLAVFLNLHSDLLPDVDGIARSFIVSYLDYLKYEIPNEVREKVRANPFQQNSDDPLIDLWQYTFSKLRKIGVAEQIFTFENRYNLGRNNIALMSNSSLNDLILDWCLYPNTTAFSLTEFDSIKTKQIQLIILKQEVWLSKFKAKVDYAIKHSNKSKWEKFALDELQLDILIQLHGEFQNRVTLWEQILVLLTQDELKTFESWVLSNFKRIGINQEIDLQDVKREFFTNFVD